MTDVAVILLAGGSGLRFGHSTPKQFLELHGKPLAQHSLDLFLSIPAVSTIVIVADASFHSLFPAHPMISFANPGARRQDSLFNGLSTLTEKHDLILIHDAARPLIDRASVDRLLTAACTHGAATLGVPVKCTLKEHTGDLFVKHTPDRSRFWEIQTPQAMTPTLLREGFRIANQRGLTVTDDASLVELTGHPVKLVEGTYNNIKITTPEDLLIATTLSHAEV